MRRAARRVLLALPLLMAAATARADDWLAALDGPALSELQTPELRLVYPMPGLPALVAAGDVLVARVLVPAALTPPPGVQQVRSLTGFSAELIGSGFVLMSGAQHRHRVTISEVRPDGPSSLMYRIRIEVPAYVAPGTYGLTVRTPFGERMALAAVRVLAPGAAPRLAGCPPPSAADLGSWPVDVYVCDDAPSWPTPEPRLGQGDGARLALTGAPALALRIGTELWLHAEGSAHDAGFARDANDAVTIERRSRVELSPAMLEQRLLKLTAARSLSLSRGDQNSLRVSCGATLASPAEPSAHACEVTLLLPARTHFYVGRGALALYPASDLQMSEVRSVLGVLRMAPGVATIEPDRKRRQDDYQLDATRARSGKHVTLRVQGAPADARVAFDYGHGRTAFAGPELHASFVGPLEEPVRALVLPRDGGARLLRARVLVEPSRPPSCDIGRRLRQEPAGGTAVAAMVLFALGFLLKRRSARGPGNRLGRDDRL